MRGIRIPETRRARTLRQSQTDAEAKLWQKLRGRRLNGFKFVRQEPVGPYFADFLNREARLVIEIDGATHASDEERAKDTRRTGQLASLGYTVIRFQNIDILENTAGVLESILARLEGRDTL